MGDLPWEMMTGPGLLLSSKLDRDWRLEDHKELQYLQIPLKLEAAAALAAQAAAGCCCAAGYVAAAGALLELGTGQ